MNGVQGGVGDGEPAAAAAGALPGDVRPNVGRAADAAVVLAHTATELHAAVPSRNHHDHLITARAVCLERLPLTVVHRFCSTENTIISHDQGADP